MSKRKKIRNLQKQIDELEARLAIQDVKVDEPVKKPAKTAVNVYFDSNFVNGLMPASECRYTREGNVVRAKKKPKRKMFRLFLKILWKLIVISFFVALIVGILSVVAMGVVWLLVNVGVITTTQNGLIIFLWKVLTKLFSLFGMTVPMV